MMLLFNVIIGTLQYWLNGLRLGVAVEGLSGHALYPAFSLYNEDDQLSLVHSRAGLHWHGTTDNRAEAVTSVNGGAAGTEYILDRYYAQLLCEWTGYLQTMVDSCTFTAYSNTSTERAPQSLLRTGKLLLVVWMQYRSLRFAGFIGTKGLSFGLI